MNLSITSPVFNASSMIPSKFTCDGENISPPLIWQDSTLGVTSYVLIVNDPDAPSGTWSHWVLFNLPPNVKQLSEATMLPIGAISGKNGWNETGYRGPCLPSGTHRYLFKLYALDTMLTLNENAAEDDIMQAMQHHILATTELMGLYKRR